MVYTRTIKGNDYRYKSVRVGEKVINVYMGKAKNETAKGDNKAH